MVAVRVTCPAAAEDEVVTLLWERGTLGLEQLAAGENTSVMIAYFPSDAVDGLFGVVRAIPGARAEPANVKPVDWVAQFRAGFRAFDAGGFRILPAWEEGAASPGPRTLVVDPGQAFGTGTHETTRLCLAALERLAASPGLGRVLDVGTGSGLLAIAAIRLGARGCVAVDNDVEAILSAARHARLNRVSTSLLVGDGGRPLQRGRFETVVANLTAALLIQKSLELTGLRSAQGRLVLSGFLEPDVPELRDAYASLGPLEESRDGEWAALVIGPARA